MSKTKTKPETAPQEETGGDCPSAPSSASSVRERTLKHEIFNDHFQNYKRHAIPKAQLVIADIPYNIGKNAYGSSPAWYE
jgi:site-specific DNA-methyltransferase (adenine-specific)